MLGGYIDITRLNDETLEPETSYVVPVRAQRLEVVIDWPLPGMAGWTAQPTPREPVGDEA